MTHFCIKYRLNSDGTVPDFLCLHPEGVGGVYGVPSPGDTQHNDTLFIGLSEEGFENDSRFEKILAKEALVDYLTEVGSDWSRRDIENPEALIPFDPVQAADWVWNRLEVLNASG